MSEFNLVLGFMLIFVMSVTAVMLEPAVSRSEPTRLCASLPHPTGVGERQRETCFTLARTSVQESDPISTIPVSPLPIWRIQLHHLSLCIRFHGSLCIQLLTRVRMSSPARSQCSFSPPNLPLFLRRERRMHYQQWSDYEQASYGGSKTNACLSTGT